MSCKDPEKILYRSERAARAAIKEMKKYRRDGYGLLHAYRCEGHWHVGHGHKSTRKRKGMSFR